MKEHRPYGRLWHAFHRFLRDIDHLAEVPAVQTPHHGGMLVDRREEAMVSRHKLIRQTSGAGMAILMAGTAWAGTTLLPKGSKVIPAPDVSQNQSGLAPNTVEPQTALDFGRIVSPSAVHSE